MAAAPEAIWHSHMGEISRLFYLFRLAELNRRYYGSRLSSLKWKELSFRIAISLFTAGSFGALAFSTATSVKLKVLAGVLSLLAFLLSVAIPALGFERRMDEASARACAWHYAVQQLESALRFVKNSTQAGEIQGWMQCAESAYHEVASLPDIEPEDRSLIRTLEEQVNESFPPDYLWTAF